MGSTSKQTTKEAGTSTTTPDPITDAWRNDVFNRGSSMVGQTAPQYQIAGFSPQTQQSLDFAQNYAQGGAPNLQAANDASGRALSGFNPAMPMAAHAAMGGLAGNPAMQGLSQFGDGNNPHLQGLFNQGAKQVTNAVNGNFMQSGRFGNNAAQTGALTEGIGNMYSQIMAPAYEAERNRGLAAQQTMGSLWDSGMNRTMAGIDMFGGMNDAATGRALQAQQQLPGLYAYGAMPGELMGQVGSMYDTQNQAQLDANHANQNADWQRLQEYSTMMSGMPYFGTTATTGNSTTRNRGTSVGWSYNNGLTIGG